MSTMAPHAESIKPEIGLDDASRKTLADGISRVLADTYLLYIKSQNFHWNVTGPRFHDLHALFEEHYQELAMAVDEIAERIRALGFFAPATYAQFSEMGSIEESKTLPDANGMIKELLAGHEQVVRQIRPVLDKASEASDEVTVDLFVQRMQFHEKTAWMLRSMLE